VPVLQYSLYTVNGSPSLGKAGSVQVFLTTSTACPGVTAFDAADGAPVPTEFVAVTVKVYDVPFVRPVTVSGLALPVSVFPPGFEVTV